MYGYSSFVFRLMTRYMQCYIPPRRKVPVWKPDAERVPIKISVSVVVA